MKFNTTVALTLALLLGAPFQVHAHDMQKMSMDADAGAETQAIGVINATDAANSTVNISHEAIPSLGWSAMTMDFKVKDNKMLAGLGKGKKVHFSFVERQGDYLITKIK